MADPISLVGSIVGAVSLTFSAFSFISRSTQIGFFTSDYNFLQSSKPRIPILLRLIAPQLQSHLHSLNEVITTGPDEVFERFRTSYGFDCNMVAVAGAIIAQIAVTSLTLPYLSQTHWVARGFLILSVISGSLSVYFCVATQKIIGTQYTPQEVRHWLTAPIPRVLLSQVGDLERKLTEVVKVTDADGGVDAEMALYPTAKQIEQVRAALFEKTPSMLSVVVLSVPAFILNISLSALLIALGVYLGFIWTRNLDTDAGLHDSRNVFIFYIVGVFTMIAVYFVPNALKDSEGRQQAVRKRVVNLLEQVQERSTRRPVAPDSAGVVPTTQDDHHVKDDDDDDDDNDDEKVKEQPNVSGAVTRDNDDMLGDIGKVLEKSIHAQEALLKANLELLSEIRRKCE